jgi:hypothetical protein
MYKFSLQAAQHNGVTYPQFATEKGLVNNLNFFFGQPSGTAITHMQDSLKHQLQYPNYNSYLQLEVEEGPFLLDEPVTLLMDLHCGLFQWLLHASCSSC